jgi:gluconokinase
VRGRGLGARLSDVFLIVMGVSGCGKSTVGSELAARLGWTFLDADDFHSPANIEKMRRALPLDADDRRPWIDALIARLNSEPQAPAVLACSALTREIRARFRTEIHAKVEFVYLKADYARLYERLTERQHHFAKVGLLASQFETLQEPECALIIAADQAPEAICEHICERLALSCKQRGDSVA